jgi:hypothetical protein
MTDFEHEIELDDMARERWMLRQKRKTVVRKAYLEFDEHGKLVRR